MNRSRAIIVCDHGLGHLRRCMLQAREMELLGEQVTLFARQSAVKRVEQAIPEVSGLSVVDFDTYTTPELIKQGLPEAIKWLDRLPRLDKFDEVISDNLPEILSIRPDAIICAQFFWHDVIQDAGKAYSDFCTNLLTEKRPTIMGCDLFAMDVVRQQPGYRPVGLYKNPALALAADNMSPGERLDLLVTGGTTSAVRPKLQKVVSELVKNGPGQFRQVHVDSSLIVERAPSWMVEATFSVDMYCRIKAAICRPGLGVVTDLLTVGAEIIPVFEGGNFEMLHNARRLEEIAQSTA